jgi:hypothetical protein
MSDQLRTSTGAKTTAVLDQAEKKKVQLNETKILIPAGDVIEEEDEDTHEPSHAISPFQQFATRIKEKLSQTIPKDAPWFRYLTNSTLVVHAYNFFQITLGLAWTCNFLNPAIFFFCYLGDVLLLMKEAASCFVEFEDEFGVSIKDLQMISDHYLFEQKGLFRIFSSIPWDIIPLAIAYGQEGACSISVTERILRTGVE